MKLKDCKISNQVWAYNQILFQVYKIDEIQFESNQIYNLFYNQVENQVYDRIFAQVQNQVFAQVGNFRDLISNQINEDLKKYEIKRLL